jgi:hypothetical protein
MGRNAAVLVVSPVVGSILGGEFNVIAVLLNIQNPHEMRQEDAECFGVFRILQETLIELKVSEVFTLELI